MQFSVKVSWVAMTVCLASMWSDMLAQSTTQLTAPSQITAPSKQLRSPDVMYVPTPPEVVDAMLKVANVRAGDVLYDLGSGDGRIPIIAVQKYKVARATGIEINPERIKEAQENLNAAGVGDRVRFRNEDLFEANFSDATVVSCTCCPRLTSSCCQSCSRI